jgi:hypothetical protein
MAKDPASATTSKLGFGISAVNNITSRFDPAHQESYDAAAPKVAPEVVADHLPPELDQIQSTHETTVIVERTIESVSLPSTDTRFAAIEPAPPIAAPALTRIEVPPNRTVHVRIGAIEIHGVAPAAAMPAPMAVAAHASSPPQVQGFGEFVHLRSYAQWQW